MQLSEMAEISKQFFQTKEETAAWLREHKIKNFKIRDNLNVDVFGDVKFMMLADHDKHILHLPVKFNDVHGDFLAFNAGLVSLVGSPNFIKGDYCIHSNPISSLNGFTPVITGYTTFLETQIHSLHNIHKHIKLVRDIYLPEKQTHVLGLFLIKGLRNVVIPSTVEPEMSYVWHNIIQKNLREGDIHKCQEELIEVGYPEMAKI